MRDDAHRAADPGLGGAVGARRGADSVRAREVDSRASPGPRCRSRRRASRRSTRSRPNELYYNLGCYCQVRRPAGSEPYYYTKIMDRKCFELGGIKMLYSSSFLTESEFDRSTTARTIER